MAESPLGIALEEVFSAMLESNQSTLEVQEECMW
jgi:hypothetical protein